MGEREAELIFHNVQYFCHESNLHGVFPLRRSKAKKNFLRNQREEEFEISFHGAGHPLKSRPLLGLEVIRRGA
jgi:hypothetical protein